MAESKNYYIKIHGALVEVTEEVYLTYYRMRRRCSAQVERDKYNGVVSYDAMDTEETLGEETIPDLDAPSVEDGRQGRGGQYGLRSQTLPDYFSGTLRESVMKCLSRVTGNCHARFLGEKAGVIPLTQPTQFLAALRPTVKRLRCCLSRWAATPSSPAPSVGAKGKTASPSR